MLRSVYHVSHVFEDTLLFIQCGLLWPLLLCVDNMMQKFFTATFECSKCIKVRLEFVATTVYPPSKFSSVETCCAHSLKCTLEETKLIRGTSPITFLLGTPFPSKIEEFSEKFQTAFAPPPPSFSESYIANFLNWLRSLQKMEPIETSIWG